MPQDLSVEDIERMRAILAQYDNTSNRDKVQEFDLNNPPKVAYAHQEFPRMIYSHATGKTRVVQGQRELDSYREKGWSVEPMPAMAAEENLELDPESAAEAAAIDAKLKKRKAA